MSQRVLFPSVCRRLTRSQITLVASLSQQCQRCLSSTSSRTGFNSSNTFSNSQPISPFPLQLQSSRPFQSSRQHQAQSHPSLDRRLPFSTTPVKHATSVSLNPRVDDDGNPMMVEISPRAAKRLRELTDPSSSSPSQSPPYNHLRVTVTSGGCHGFQYLMSLESLSKIDPDEDTVFEADSQDHTSKPPGGGGAAKVVMDSASLELLRGSTIDYTVELIGSQFKVANNPRATSNCGCGTSFDVK
ncbi:[4Fe-4S] proteins maturation [Emydomyces testavorans]|uniref:[4Fe-4S] proteins maturation n=1 Tax=Emydomyces testavorans TaxID=2070801 RepID=A0AAF0DIR7_9EURO|nr:[4Fe-4S] proteins maturation [Emydomyces testavorans]